MNKQYKPNEFAKLINVSVKTLQRWDNEGTLAAFRSPIGYSWFDEFLKSCGVELVQDLISITHVFSCRIYGLRKYKKKLEEDDNLC